MNNTLLAGAAETIITPPVGLDMTGFGGRPSGNVGVHDDLYARAVVMAPDDKPENSIALVAMDLLSLDAEMVDRIRAGIREATGIGPDGLCLNCSHTHHGPVSIRLRGMGDANETYRALLVKNIVSVVKSAQQSITRARLFAGRSAVQIGVNRRERTPDGSTRLGVNEGGPMDREVRVLRVERIDGAPIAIVFNHATHGVCLGGQNLLTSADFVGYAASQVKDTLGSEAVPIFLQGCCGNINPQNACQTSFENAERLGRQLGKATIVAWEAAIPVAGALIPKAARKTIKLPLLDPPSVEKAGAQLDMMREQLNNVRAASDNRGMIRIHEAFVQWAEDILSLARDGSKSRFQDFELQAVAVGDCALLGMPGEVFFEYAQRIEAASPFPHTMVLAYHNGCIGYVPTAAAYPEGGYEVTEAIKFYGTLMMKPESEDLIVNEATGLLVALHTSLPV